MSVTGTEMKSVRSTINRHPRSALAREG
jgi:hypothetical protein